jgi:MerR family transcriptional regulator, light-induced transcriptional regulator
MESLQLEDIGGEESRDQIKDIQKLDKTLTIICNRAIELQEQSVSTECNNRKKDVQETVTNAIIDELICRANWNLPSHERCDPSVTSPVSASMPETRDVILFTRMLIDKDNSAPAAHVSSRLEAGESLESLYLNLLEPAARQLGTLWETDECNFIDVTIGVGRLQQIMRNHSATFLEHEQPTVPSCECRRALLMPAHGDQHTFGVGLVAEFLRRADWEILGWPMVTEERDLLSLVRNEWLAFIGISAAAEVNLAGLTSKIKRFRSFSKNPNVKILVGGHIFTNNPDLVTQVGADATATDARQALLSAESLLEPAWLCKCPKCQTSS